MSEPGAERRRCTGTICAVPGCGTRGNMTDGLCSEHVSSPPPCPDCGGPMLDGVHVSPFAACLYEDEP